MPQQPIKNLKQSLEFKLDYFCSDFQKKYLLLKLEEHDGKNLQIFSWLTCPSVLK